MSTLNPSPVPSSAPDRANRRARRGVVLVGGLGTRLRAAVSDRPKPLAVVGGRPFLEYPLRQLRAAGIKEVVLCVGYGADMIQDAFGTGDELGLEISYSVETSLLGTAGAIKLAEPLLGGSTFVAMNGDSFFDVELETLLRFHESTTAIATLALASVED